MKRILAVAVLALATVPAMAQHHHGHYHGHRSGNWGWTVPLIIGVGGAAVVYGAPRLDPIILQHPPVVIQQPPVYQYPQTVQNCTPWTETQNPNGTITRTRTCNQ
jgi:hypothetical protein